MEIALKEGSITAEDKRILQNPTEIFKNIPHQMSLILRLNR